MTREDITCQWCGSNEVTPTKNGVKVDNAQIEIPHVPYTCGECQKLTLVAAWSNRSYSYRGVIQPRFLLPNLYVVLYEVACAWCGSDSNIEPLEINATINNPASNRHRYDIYACFACDHYTAVSYLGEIYTYRAKQDNVYRSLYHLVADEE